MRDAARIDEIVLTSPANEHRINGVARGVLVIETFIPAAALRIDSEGAMEGNNYQISQLKVVPAMKKWKMKPPR